MKEQRPTAARARLRHDCAVDRVRHLAALGVTVPLAGERGELAAEVPLTVSVGALLRDGRYALGVQRRLGRLAASGDRVCLQPTLADGTAGQWDAFLARLRQLLPDGAPPPALCLQSHQLPLAEFAGTPDDGRLFGSVYVYCDSLQMRPHADRRVQAATDANWRVLWKCRSDGARLLPVYGGFVRSACPLLGDEAAAAVLPVTGLNVPLGSAWLALGVDLPDFADGAGRLDHPDLQAAIDEAVRIADALLGSKVHTSAAQRRDAAENRRLALMIDGIGDLVSRRAGNPASLDCLHELDADLQAIRDGVDRASARESRRSGPLPALSLPCRDWFDGQYGIRWRQQFEAARRQAAVRHRNLLAMSPYSVLPRVSSSDPRFADLLPLLAFADAWAFAGAPDFERWNLSQFKHFHTRARAIIQASQVTTRIAAGA